MTEEQAGSSEQMTPWWLWVVAYVLLVAAQLALGLAAFYALEWLALAGVG